MKKILALLLGFMFYNVLAAQQDIIFSLKIDADTLLIGERFKCEFVLEGAQTRHFSAPEFDGFEMAMGSSQSMQTQIINGKMSQQSSYIYWLRPVKSGQLVIPSNSIEVNGEILTSEPATIVVLNEKVHPDYVPKQPKQQLQEEEKVKKKRRIYKI